MKKHLRSLCALGEAINHRHFVSLIKSKLPKQVLTRLEEQNDGQQWSVDSLRELLKKYICARETADRQANHNHGHELRQNGSISSTPRAFTTNRRSTNYPNRERSSAEASVVNNQQRSAGFRRPCAYCQSDHWCDECQKYKTIESRKARIKGCCFNCLTSGHFTKDCRAKKQCIHCGAFHHRSLCSKVIPNDTGRAERQAIGNRQESANVAPEVADDSEVSDTDQVLLASDERVLLQTATALLKNEKACWSVQGRILFDCGSQRSYITKDLAEKLKLKAKQKEVLSVITFGSGQPKSIETSSAEIEIMQKDGSYKKLMVNIVEKITGTIKRSPVHLKKSFLWQDLPLADSFPTATESTSIDCLIGSDYYIDMVTSERICLSPGLYLIGSSLGWILTGRIQEKKSKDDELTMHILSYTNSDIVSAVTKAEKLDACLNTDPVVADFWNLETIGITESPYQSDDERALQSFKDTVKFADQRYQVKWPWKSSNPELPDNFELAKGRLKSLIKRLSKDKELMHKYNSIIEDQLQKGIIEIVSADTEEGPFKHYIPHHAVVTPQKATTKVRIVYDASAKTKRGNNSLNECLFRGPVILEDLCGLLIRFRLHRIVIIADIEKAFLQVGLQVPERDVTRFLWLKNTDKPDVESNLQVLRFTRVAFGVISSPFLLGATIQHHLQSIGSGTAAKISQNMYVDNVITGVESTEKAVQFYAEAKDIFSKASMNLREWTTNDDSFLKTIPEKDRATGDQLKVLGLSWNRATDQISVPSFNYEFGEIATKRSIMKLMASIFDPLGYFSPVTLKAKIILQNTWRKQIDWDQPLPAEIIAEWNDVSKDLNQIPNTRLTRLISSDQKDAKYDLLCFSDASGNAYAATVYLRVHTATETSVNLVFAKTRLAPVSNMTIPRLELLAMLIGTRSMIFVEKELRLPIQRKILWSDSKCVLHWLKSDKKLPVFVENRIAEIKNSKLCFRYIISEQNPADIASRGASIEELASSKRWWYGPEWLLNSPNVWPTWKTLEIEPERAADETNVKQGCSIFFEVGLQASDAINSEVAPFEIKEDKYSSLTKLLRITASVCSETAKEKFGN